MPATATQTTLGEALAKRTVEAAPELVDKLENNAVRCYSCGHRCKVLDGLKGICKVRYNEDGVLRVPRGYAAPSVSRRRRSGTRPMTPNISASFHHPSAPAIRSSLRAGSLVRSLLTA
jgi:hypothetical protein